MKTKRLTTAVLAVLLAVSAANTSCTPRSTANTFQRVSAASSAKLPRLLAVRRPRFLVFQRDGYAYEFVLGSHRAPRRIVKIGETGFGDALTRTHIYWITIPRKRYIRENIMVATTKGTRVHTFVARIGEGETVFVAGDYLYWDGTRAIGRARLNGTHVNRRFIVLPEQKPAGAYGPENGLATDGRYLYFVRCSDGIIGRVPLANKASYTTIPWVLRTHSECPQDLAVADGYLYWDVGAGDVGGGAIGRASITGGSASAHPHWVRTHTIGGPFGVTATRRYLFWDWSDGPNGDPSYVARVNADGHHPRRKFFNGQTPLTLAP